MASTGIPGMRVAIMKVYEEATVITGLAALHHKALRESQHT